MEEKADSRSSQIYIIYSPTIVYAHSCHSNRVPHDNEVQSINYGTGFKKVLFASGLIYCFHVLF